MLLTKSFNFQLEEERGSIQTDCFMVRDYLTLFITLYQLFSGSGQNQVPNYAEAGLEGGVVDQK